MTAELEARFAGSSTLTTFSQWRTHVQRKTNSTTNVSTYLLTHFAEFLCIDVIFLHYAVDELNTQKKRLS